MSQELIKQIDRIVRVDSAETNELAIEDKTEQIRRTMSEIMPRTPSRMAIQRQTVVRRDSEGLSRWNWTGRFWHWTAAVNFTSPSRGELLMRRTEKLFAWFREQNRAKQIVKRYRDFFEIKTDFDATSIEITNAYVKGNYQDLRRLLLKQAVLLDELNELAHASGEEYTLAAIEIF